VELYLHSPNTPPWCGTQLKHRDDSTFAFKAIMRLNDVLFCLKAPVTPSPFQNAKIQHNTVILFNARIEIFKAMKIHVVVPCVMTPRHPLWEATFYSVCILQYHYTVSRPRRPRHIWIMFLYWCVT
jgi:hypothetical protein